MTTVLIIEDEKDLRENFADFLTEAGFRVLAADRGEIGINMANQYLPDVIICDIMMPDLDGYEVLLQLRSDLTTVNIPFIFLTAKTDKLFMRYGMEIGADDYLTKPALGSELVTAINSRLERQATLKQEYATQLDELRHSLVTSLPNTLQAPLTGILGHADLLITNIDKISSERTTSIAESIRTSAQLLQRQIENYLLYAQLELLKSDSRQWGDISNHITANPGEQIANVASHQALRWNRESDLTITVANAPISIATKYLQKIADELIDNAFKFSKPDTSVQVKVDIGDDTLAFFVANQGHGMTHEQIKNIGAYMRFAHALVDQPGLGLGLAVAKSLIDLHNAEITISSLPDKHITVCVEFPLLQN